MIPNRQSQGLCGGVLTAFVAFTLLFTEPGVALMPNPPIPENIADQEHLINTPLQVQRPAEAFPKSVPKADSLREADLEWVEASLAAMSLEQKIGQLFMPSTGSTTVGTAEAQITQYHVGGFCFLGNGQSAADVVNRVNALQQASAFPLWFSIDSEAGLGARVADATIFPLLMAFGATGDPELAELCGQITARESRALGIQITFGPVVDVNTEPINPIISTRSYSDRPDLVTLMARGYLKGARSQGILGTLKHYPGHGASTGDSHSSLPTIDLSFEELDQRHIAPYRALGPGQEVDMIMTAHIWFSSVEPGTPFPATLSGFFGKDVLRHQIGYQGILISDAYDMVGLTLAVPDAGERGVLGIEAGLDIILGVANNQLGATWNGVRNAVLSGRLSMEQINESVRRVLIAKSRVGLPEERLVDANLWRQVLNHPDHRAIVRRVCERACTKVFDRTGGNAPLLPNHRALVIDLVPAQRIFYRFGTETFRAHLSALHPDLNVISGDRSINATTRQQIVTTARGYDRVIVVGTDWTRISAPDQATLVNALVADGASVVYAGFGAPYHVQAIPGVAAFYCGYSTVPEMQEVMAEVLTGARQPEGRLPVEFDDLAPPPQPSMLMLR